MPKDLKSVIRRFCAIAVVISSSLAACGSFVPEGADITSLEALPMRADPHLAALQKGYVALAKQEQLKSDRGSATVFAQKALDAAKGDAPEPFAAPGDEDPVSKSLAQARLELVGYLADPGAKLRAGREVGELQVAYDCWLKGTVEDRQSAVAAECRVQFDNLSSAVNELSKLPGNIVSILKAGQGGGVVVTTLSGTRELMQGETASDRGEVFVSRRVIEQTFAASLAAFPPPPIVFELYFDIGSAEITDSAFNVIYSASQEVLVRPAAEVAISGHADPGSERRHALSLSRRRAEAVERALRNELPENEIVSFSIKGYGVRRPLIPTSEPEAKNRRVTFVVR